MNSPDGMRRKQGKFVTVRVTLLTGNTLLHFDRRILTGSYYLHFST